MQTITTHEAKTHLSRYLADVEQGARFIIARGNKKVAMLVPIPQEQNSPRPRVGETLDPDWTLPDAAFAPLSEAELEGWGL